jgi:hypothetical protein
MDCWVVGSGWWSPNWVVLTGERAVISVIVLGEETV